jgi:predicted XRE-type DNA-binding protein
MKKIKTDKAVTSGSGNVFADLKVPQAAEMLAKARVVGRICALIEEAGMTQTEAARRLGVDQPKVSALLRGRLEGFSTERLFRLLNALGQDVEVLIQPAEGGNSRGKIRVVAVNAA